MTEEVGKWEARPALGGCEALVVGGSIPSNAAAAWQKRSVARGASRPATASSPPVADAVS